jgi:hypothetical protein
MTTSDAKTEPPLYRYVRDIHLAVDAGALYSALALALTIPDICGAIEYPNEPAANKRYREWFKVWCGFHRSQMTAADCWALRCTYLHLAREQFEGDAATFAALERIQFTVGKSGGGWLSKHVEPASAGAKPAVQIPTETFCRDMAGTALGWFKKRENEAGVAVGLAKLLEIRPAE